MKILCLIPIFMFITGVTHAQDSAYKYKYIFRCYPISCKEKVLTRSKKTADSTPVLTIAVKGCDRSKIYAATIVLSGADSIITVTDAKGKARIVLKRAGAYKLTIATAGYEDATSNISVSTMQRTTVSVRQMLSPLSTIYEIDSTIPLDEKKIDKIKKCAHSKKNLFSCAEPGVYIVGV